MPLPPLSSNSAQRPSFQRGTTNDVLDPPVFLSASGGTDFLSTKTTFSSSAASVFANVGSATKSMIDKSSVKNIVTGMRTSAWTSAFTSTFAKVTQSSIHSSVETPSIAAQCIPNVVDNDVTMSDVIVNSDVAEYYKPYDLRDCVPTSDSLLNSEDLSANEEESAIAKKAESEENLHEPSLPRPFILPIVPTDGCKPVLALDLDETLIHSSLVPRRPADFWIEVIQNNDIRTRELFWVYKRPGADEFLQLMAKHFTVLVFTAGIREYASQILDKLDPTGELICARLYRDSCTETRSGGTTFSKDMNKLCTDLSKVLLVDNTPGCFQLQPANGVLIKSWYTDTKDTELDRLGQFLINITDAKDLRLVAREWAPHC